jgi:hypothetical protein
MLQENFFPANERFDGRLTGRKLGPIFYLIFIPAGNDEHVRRKTMGRREMPFLSANLSVTTCPTAREDIR